MDPRSRCASVVAPGLESGSRLGCWFDRGASVFFFGASARTFSLAGGTGSRPAGAAYHAFSFRRSGEYRARASIGGNRIPDGGSRSAHQHRTRRDLSYGWSARFAGPEFYQRSDGGGGFPRSGHNAAFLARTDKHHSRILQSHTRIPPRRRPNSPFGVVGDYRQSSKGNRVGGACWSGDRLAVHRRRDRDGIWSEDTVFWDRPSRRLVARLYRMVSH